MRERFELIVYPHILKVVIVLQMLSLSLFKWYYSCLAGPKACRKGRCGRGECVLTSTPPFYECKCKEPFQPPRCRTGECCLSYPICQFPTVVSCSIQKHALTEYYFFTKLHRVNVIHVKMVEDVSGMAWTLTASALQGTAGVSAMLVNTVLCIVFQFFQSNL